MSRSASTTLLKAFALSLALVTAGCMTPTPYAPKSEGQATGYTDRALAENRYRVTFTGNSSTPPETVESYLVLRAAEVAQAAGYSHFVFDIRNSNISDRLSGGAFGRRSGFTFGGGLGFGSGGYGRGWGGSGVGIGFSSGSDVTGGSNYEAYAEIVLLTPEQARQEARAMSTADVLAHLRPDRGNPRL